MLRAKVDLAPGVVREGADVPYGSPSLGKRGVIVGSVVRRPDPVPCLALPGPRQRTQSAAPPSTRRSTALM